jgi:hypothetical protein
VPTLRRDGRPRTSPILWVLAVRATVLVGCGTAGSGSSAGTLVIGSPCRTCLKTLLTASGESANTPYSIEFAGFDSAPSLIEAMNAGRVDVA